MTDQMRTGDITSIPPEMLATLEKVITSRIQKDRKVRFDLDMKAILAFLAIFGAFLLALVNLLRFGTADIPAWSAGLVSSVAVSYFASKGTGTNGGPH